MSVEKSKNNSDVQIGKADAVQAHESLLNSLQSLNACPYLAMFDDLETKILFPSPAGYCHRVNPEDRVTLDHQQSFCLRAEHLNCPVFKQENLQALPPGIKRASTQNNGSSLNKAITAILLIALLAFGGWVVSGRNLAADNAEENNPAIAAVVATATETKIVPTDAVMPTKTAVSTALPTKTAVFTPTPEATAVNNTPTPVPTATKTPQPTATPQPFAVAEIIPGLLNIRNAPDIEADVLLIAETGAFFDITGQSADGVWYQICCVADEKGWLWAESVNVSNQVGTIPIITPTALEN